MNNTRRVSIACAFAFASCFAASIPATAQEGLPEGYEVRTIKAKYDFDLVFNLLQGYADLVHVTTADEKHGIITLVGMSEIIDQIENAIEKYDVPRKNLELHFHLIEASREAGPNSVSKELEPVINQLQKTLVYKSYRSMDPIILRVRDGASAKTNGTLPGPDEEIENGEWVPGGYSVEIKSVNVSQGDGHPVAELQGLELEVSSGYENTPSVAPNKVVLRRVQTSGTSGHIYTTIDVPTDQQVVVGKTTLSDTDGALIVVLSAKIVD